MNKSNRTPQEISDQVAESYFGVGPDNASRQHTIRALLVGALESAILIPLLFYVRYGEVPGLGWGTTVFFVFYCLLSATGLYIRPRTEYHTQVKLCGDWVDRVGAFWLMSCAFGPLLGWVITSVFPITLTSWQWLYSLRLIFAAGLPLITALPLTRYIRGKSAWVALPILVIITILPILSVVNISRDLWNGPVVTQAQSEVYLQYTKQSLDVNARP
jgi:hypothetical protein